MSDDYVIAFRKITRATDERTSFATLVKREDALGDTLTILDIGQFGQPQKRTITMTYSRENDYELVFRDITNATNERTSIAALGT